MAGPTIWHSLPDNLRDPHAIRQLQALIENVFVFSTPVQLTHKMSYDDALYKFTFYLFTYLLDAWRSLAKYSSDESLLCSVSVQRKP